MTSGPAGGDDAAAADGGDGEDVVAGLEGGGEIDLEDVEVDGGVGVGGEVGEEMAVEEDVGFAGAGEVEGGVGR